MGKVLPEKKHPINLFYLINISCLQDNHIDLFANTAKYNCPNQMVSVSMGSLNGTSIVLSVVRLHIIQNTGTCCTRKTNVKSVVLYHKINVSLI